MWDREAEPGEKAEEGDQPGEEEGGESVIGVSLVQGRITWPGLQRGGGGAITVSEATNLQLDATKNNAILVMKMTGTIICQQSDDSHLTSAWSITLYCQSTCLKSTRNRQ